MLKEGNVYACVCVWGGGRGYVKAGEWDMGGVYVFYVRGTKLER